LQVGLVKAVDLDLGTTLLFTGVYNIISGLVFDIPIPVQPMKTIAAVALSEPGALTLPQILAAGIFVSACVLFLGITGLMGIATRIIPPAVIRGMQLGVGLGLSLKGFQQVWYANGKAPPIRQWWTIEGLFLGLFTTIFILLTVYPASAEREAGVESIVVEDEMLAAAVGGCTTLNSIGEGSNLKPATETLLYHDSGTSKQATEEFGNVSIGEMGAVSSAEEGCAAHVEASPSSTDGGAATAVLRFPSRIHHALSPAAQRIFRPIMYLGDRADIATGGRAGANSNPCSVANLPASRIPAALILVVIGLVLTLITTPSVISTLSLGPTKPQILVVTAADWRTAILRAGLPQLSLTTFNSVISVCQLAEQMFPDRPPRPGAVATSVGMMNLVGCWFGAMPSCHGAGGLAGQVRFGARSGAAPMFLGLLKVLLSLLLGSSLFKLFQIFPAPILGAMLVFAGMELAAVAKGQRTVRGVAIMLLTASVSLALNNVAWGVVFGLGGAYLLALRDWVVGEAVPAAKAAVRRLNCA